MALSDSSDLALRLRGTAALSGRVEASLAITGGVHTALDVVKATMAGAHVDADGLGAPPERPSATCARSCADLEAWMEENEWSSLDEMRGNMGLRPDTRPRRLRARELPGDVPIGRHTLPGPRQHVALAPTAHT